MKYMKNGKIGYIEQLSVLGTSIILIFGLLIFTGTLTSGYHFVDDHEVVLMEFNMRSAGQSLWQVMKSFAVRDLWWRFRPFYWVERSFCAFVFGSNMLFWNIYTAIKGVIAFCLLHFSARNLKCGSICSFLFAAVIMFGQQFTPFFRSANQENTGLLLCGLILWLITRQYKLQNFKDRLSNVWLCICIIICGLTKESFTLCMPAFMALKYWLEYCSMPIQKNRWISCLKKNAAVYLVVTAAFLCDLYFIMFKVGVDNVSYAGFHEGTTLRQYMTAVYENLFQYTKAYTYVGLIVLVIIIMAHDWNRKIDKNVIIKYSGYIIIGVYVMGVQLISYAQSRIWERYLIPYIIGYAFLVVILGYKFFEGRKVQRRIYILMLLFLTLSQTLTAYRKSSDWAKDGVAINSFLDALREHTNPDCHIVSAFADEELNISVETYMEAKGYSGLLSYRFAEESIVDLVEISENNWENAALENADLVVCYDYYIPIVTELMGISETERYEVYDFSGYDIIARTGSR